VYSSHGKRLAHDTCILASFYKLYPSHQSHPCQLLTKVTNSLTLPRDGAWPNKQRKIVVTVVGQRHGHEGWAQVAQMTSMASTLIWDAHRENDLKPIRCTCGGHRVQLESAAEHSYIMFLAIVTYVDGLSTLRYWKQLRRLA
jgi:hypothetical protein